MQLNDEVIHDYDIVIVGGGSAGVAAAMSAAKLSMKVALIERFGYLGGAGTISSVQAFCGFFDQTGEQVVRGVGEEVLNQLQAIGTIQTVTSKHSGNTIIVFNKEDLKVALDTLCLDAGIDIFLHSTVFAVSTETNKITRISATHRGGVAHFTARQFIDTSGDGVLIQRSNADLLLTEPQERQASTLVMHMSGVTSDADLSPKALTQAIQQELGTEHKVAGNVAVRLDDKGQIMLLMVDEHFDALSVEATTYAEQHARRRAAEYFGILQTLPGFSNAALIGTGPQIGIRETIRLHGKTLVTEGAIIDAVKLNETGIARCGWPMEDHAIPGKTSYIGIKHKGWFHIPLDVLASRNVTNLWAAGRLTSSDRKAFTSIRVMGTAFATGHAAGVAASLRITHQSNTDDIARIREILTSQGALV